MASTFTTNLRLVKQAAGDNSSTWGTVFNQQFSDLVDTAIAGYLSIALANADITLTVSQGVTDQARYAFLNFTGALTANRNVIVPATAKIYTVANATTGGFSLTFKTATGTGIAVAMGNTAIVACDGTNVVVASTAGTVTAVAGSLTSNAVVLGAGTADTKVAAGITTDGTSALNLGVAGTSVGKVVMSNATSGTMTVQPPTGALGAVTVTVPAATDTLVNLAGVQTLTNKTFVAPALGTPASGVLTNATGLPLTTGVTGVLPVANFATGTPTGAKFVRDDGTLQVPPTGGGGGGDAIIANGLAQFTLATTSLTLKNIINDETGSGSLTFATSPALITPLLGTPTSGVLTNCTGLPLTTGVTGVLPVANYTTGTPTGAKFVRDDGVLAVPAGAGDATVAGGLGQFAATTSAALKGVINDETGGGALVFATSPTLVTPLLGTPTSGVLTNCTGLPVAGGGTGVATLTAYSPVFAGTTATGALQSGSVGTTGQVLTSNGAGALATFQTLAVTAAGGLGQFAAASTTSAQLANVISDETGSGALVFATSPTLVTPALGTPTSGSLVNCTGLPVAGGGTGLATSGLIGAIITSGGGTTPFVYTTSPNAAGNVLTSNGVGAQPSFQSPAVTVAGGLGQFSAASTTSSALAGVMSDETGSGALVFATSPTLVTPVLGTPSSGSLVNCTGYPVGGSTTQILFNDSSTFGGDADFTWDKTNNVLTLGSTTTAPSIKTTVGSGATAGAALTISTGVGGATSAGGALTLVAGAGGSTSGAGGAISITSGAGGTGIAGAVDIAPGVSAGGGFSAATTIRGGSTTQASTGGGNATVQGGNGSSTGDGGQATLQGGAGGGTSGNGGVATVSGGSAQSSGNGGNVAVNGAPGTGTNKNGGSISLVPGAGTGTGQTGYVYFSSAALATTATGGFTCIPTCAGAPTGVPGSIPTGTVPMVMDTTNSKIYFYIAGTWKGVVVA